jgi:hypothetical protein
MPEVHNIWVQHTQSEENDLDNSFQARIPSSHLLFLNWTPPNYILQFQERLHAGKPISTISKWCKNTQRWVLRPEAQEDAVMIPTKYNDCHGWVDCVDGFIQVVKLTNEMHIVPGRAILGPLCLVRKHAALGGIDSVWLVNNHVDLDTY